jgi:hypothetical protein
MLLDTLPLPMLKETGWPLPADQWMGQSWPTVTLPHVPLTKSADTCAMAARAAMPARRKERNIVVVVLIALFCCAGIEG